MFQLTYIDLQVDLYSTCMCCVNYLYVGSIGGVSEFDMLHNIVCDRPLNAMFVDHLAQDTDFSLYEIACSAM